MKKILEKIVTVSLAFVALLYVVLMIVLMFNPDYAQNLDNSLVHVLVIIFSGIFAVLTGINIYTAFADADRVNNVLLFKSRSSATKATISVVKKTAKKATHQVEGARLSKVTLFVDENNDIRMRIDLKIKAESVEDVVTKVRATVLTTFAEVLGLEFASIDFKLVKVKNEYKPDPAAVDEKVAEFKAQLEKEKEAQKRKEEEAAAQEAEAALAAKAKAEVEVLSASEEVRETVIEEEEEKETAEDAVILSDGADESNEEK